MVPPQLGRHSVRLVVGVEVPHRLRPEQSELVAIGFARRLVLSRRRRQLGRRGRVPVSDVGKGTSRCKEALPLRQSVARPALRLVSAAVPPATDAAPSLPRSKVQRRHLPRTDGQLRRRPGGAPLFALADLLR